MNERTEPGTNSCSFAALIFLVMIVFGGCRANKGAGGNTKARTPEGCEKACKVCNASENDLRAEFGEATVPDDYIWAMPFFDKAGYPAYEKCLKTAVAQGKTANDLGCTERAHHACVRACSGGTDHLAYNKCSNDYLLEASGIVGVPTNRKPSREELDRIKVEIDQKCGHLK
jgi:hypothetical protein